MEKGKRMSHPESQSLNVTLLAIAKATKGQALHTAKFTWGRGGGQETREEAAVRGQVKYSGATTERCAPSSMWERVSLEGVSFSNIAHSQERPDLRNGPWPAPRR